MSTVRAPDCETLQMKQAGLNMAAGNSTRVVELDAPTRRKRRGHLDRAQETMKLRARRLAAVTWSGTCPGWLMEFALFRCARGILYITLTRLWSRHCLKSFIGSMLSWLNRSWKCRFQASSLPLQNNKSNNKSNIGLKNRWCRQEVIICAYIFPDNCAQWMRNWFRNE